MADQLYGGLASLGQLRAKVGFACAICIGLALMGGGGFLINSTLNDKHSQTTSATLAKNCPAPSPMCQATASYTVGGKGYTLTNEWTQPVPPSVPVYYDPSNPGDATYQKPSWIPGAMLIGVAVLLIACAYLIYSLTMRYKPLAALEGADTIADFGKSIF
jgi:hypothetical protein